MSTRKSTPALGDPVALLTIAIAALTLAGIVYALSLDRKVPLNRSQVGFAGLTYWLKSQDIETLTFTGGGALRPDEIGLRILPLFDVDLNGAAKAPETDDEILLQKTEFDISAPVVERKMELVPTLVILPKWRRAVRERGIAHKAFLIPDFDVGRTGAQIGGLGSLDRPGHGYDISEITYENIAYSVGLYEPQLIRYSNCATVLGEKRAMLLARCSRENYQFWVLTDPDLLNNHGLRLGENAALAKELIPDLAGGGRVVIDLTSSIFIANSPEPDQRSWAELGRFLGGPFTIAWIGLALLAALLLWRASIRYGPIIRLFEDRPIASKTGSIEATARLLRLSGHDLELLKSHVAARCRILAADLLGPHHGIGADPVRELVKIVSRRAPGLGDKITLAVHDLNETQRDWSDAEMLRFLDRFERLYERTLHEFGRSADTRAIHSR